MEASKLCLAMFVLTALLISTSSQAASESPEFPVNTTPVGFRGNPDTVFDAAGNFVVVWASDNLDAPGIFARRFDGAGDVLGGEIHVTSEVSYSPRVAQSGDGLFPPSWPRAPPKICCWSTRARMMVTIPVSLPAASTLKGCPWTMPSRSTPSPPALSSA